MYFATITLLGVVILSCIDNISSYRSLWSNNFQFILKKQISAMKLTSLSAMTNSLHSQIVNEINSQDIVLFMKGNKDIPKCGFSATAVYILNAFKVPFHSVDVLEDM